MTREQIVFRVREDLRSKAEKTLTKYIQKNYGQNAKCRYIAWTYETKNVMRAVACVEHWRRDD